MTESTLGKISNLLKTGKTPPSKNEAYFKKDYNWFTPGDISNKKYIYSSERHISKLALKDRKGFLYPSNSVLITCIGNIGRVGISKEECASNQQITAIEPIRDVNVEYLYYWFIANQKLLIERSNTAIVPILNNKSLREIPFNYPSLESQKHIAQILDDAADLRDKTKQLLTEYDLLAQSIFLEMFGYMLDISTNMITLEKLCGKGQYGAGASAVDFDKNRPRYLRITDINEDGKLNNNKVSPSEYNDKYLLEKNDLVFARSGATVGKTYLYQPKDGDLMYAGYLIKFSIPIKYSGEYFFHFTKTEKYKAWIKSRMNVVAQPNINANQYGNDLEIPLPPIELQNQFAEKIALIEQQKEVAQQELQESEDLFNNLLQKAFKGELVPQTA